VDFTFRMNLSYLDLFEVVDLFLLVNNDLRLVRDSLLVFLYATAATVLSQRKLQLILVTS
jgi:hypothetical protein